MESFEGTGLLRGSLALVHNVEREEMPVLVVLPAFRDRRRIEASSDANDWAEGKTRAPSARAGSFRKPAPVA